MMFKKVITFPVSNRTEQIIQRSHDYLYKSKEILKNKTISIIGYGTQGRSQALNLRDSRFNVILGLRDGYSYQQALNDGWREHYNLFNIEEAAYRGDIIKFLLSDIGQIKQWNNIQPYLKMDKTLYFSHGFGITYPEYTNILPPGDIDVIMVAPKCAGTTIRERYLTGQGVNASYAIHQDFTGKAKDTCIALGFAIGCKNIFETTFKKEVYSDLVGKRCVLMGLIQGAFKAQYSVLRERGHSPTEAYNETVEEALISLWPLIKDKGMDWMYANCSTTAQRGALDWAPKFENVLKPVIEECYLEVENGNEVKKLININEDPKYDFKLYNELKQISNQEMWTIAKEIRKLRN